MGELSLFIITGPINSILIWSIENNNYSLKIGNSINSNKFKNWNSNAIADYLKNQVLKLN